MKSIDWTQVIVTLILTAPAIIAAVMARGAKREARAVHDQVKTPSNRPIGEQVEDTLHTVIANHHYVDAISKQVGAATSPRADEEAAKVNGLSDLEPPDGES